MTPTRPVFYVSDGTGITAETIGHSLLTQFGDTRFTTDRIPFVDTAEKAREAAQRIREAGEAAGLRPIVVNSCVDNELYRLLAESGGLMLDIFAPFILPLELELGTNERADAELAGQRNPPSRESDPFRRRLHSSEHAFHRTHPDTATALDPALRAVQLVGL